MVMASRLRTRRPESYREIFKGIVARYSPPSKTDQGPLGVRLRRFFDAAPTLVDLADRMDSDLSDATEYYALNSMHKTLRCLANQAGYSDGLQTALGLELYRVHFDL